MNPYVCSKCGECHPANVSCADDAPAMLGSLLIILVLVVLWVLTSCTYNIYNFTDDNSTARIDVRIPATINTDTNVPLQ